MKQKILFMAVLALSAAFAACSSDDDDRFVTCPVEPGLTGTWEFVEMLNGPVGAAQPQPHKLTFTSDSTATYTYKDGTIADQRFYFPKNQEDYSSVYPVIIIGDKGFCSTMDIPFGVELNKNQLKLHYLGISTCDHIPQTYVYRR